MEEILKEIEECLVILREKKDLGTKEEKDLNVKNTKLLITLYKCKDYLETQKKNLEDLGRNDEPDILATIEWARHTIREKLKFGLSEEQAGPRRETRANGVLIDCKKHIQKQQDKIKQLQILCNSLAEGLKDFKDFGTRHDINPTGQFKDCGCFDSFSNDNWQGYIRSQDRGVRERATEVLANNSIEITSLIWGKKEQ